MMNLILVGLPGAGKGTQAEKIVDTYHVPHISTGDMFRAAIKNETALGIQAKAFRLKSESVPDEVTNGIVKDRLAEADTKDGFLLDGYPRTLNQANVLEGILKDLNKKLDAVIYINVNKDILMERLTGRIICRSCGATYHKVYNPPKVEGTCDRCGKHDFYQREDDKPETVENRINVNLESTNTLVDFYSKRNVLHTVNGEDDFQDVFKDIQTIISDVE